MEKNTILAVVLSVVVITGFYLIQGILFPPAPQQAVTTTTQQAVPTTPSPTPQVTPAVTPQVTPAPVAVGDEAFAGGSQAEDTIAAAEDAGLNEEHITLESPLWEAVLSNKGGDLVSFKLKEHRDGDDNVNMILKGTAEPHAFTIAFGPAGTVPVTSLFHVRRAGDYSVEFYRDFAVGSANGVGAGGILRLKKLYTFAPGEYMFELSVSVDGGRTLDSINFNGAAYTLAFGPQIGPAFEKLDQQREYRHFLEYANGKLKTERQPNKPFVTNDRLSWGGIAGKYFALLVVPDDAPYKYTFAMSPDEPGLVNSEGAAIPASRLSIEMPPLLVSRDVNTLRFYMGPKDTSILAAYDKGENVWGYTQLNLEKAANTSGFWSILNPLEKLLKWLLGLFYRVIPNYGLAIMLLTLLVKLFLFPLTKKSSEGTLRMQQISPKIKELQAKYKDNPQKLNVEMAQLYKAEGYNPMSGCLPMLIQIPIFFALYNMFNNNFDLRGAFFIPGWIPDLSQPEHFIELGFRIPFLGWSALHLLPFIYVGSQLLYTKVTQTPDMQSNGQMKMMLYLMPVIFFFVLYDMPSGLAVYWIMSNVLTMVQQLIINRYMAKKKAAMGLLSANGAMEADTKKVLPPKAKKRKR